MFGVVPKYAKVGSLNLWNKFPVYFYLFLQAKNMIIFLFVCMEYQATAFGTLA